jgi:hypothetical protein
VDAVEPWGRDGAESVSAGVFEVEADAGGSHLICVRTCDAISNLTFRMAMRMVRR